jgi:hygromycin-B 7''-O-kinase
MVDWVPPELVPGKALRSLEPVGGWRTAIEHIARRHGHESADASAYERGETIVWRVGDHVVKLTKPACEYQIVAEVGCLTAVRGKLGVETPELVAHGELSGWPYVVMRRIGGRPLCDVWPRCDHDERLRFAAKLGALCRTLHALPPTGFPSGWDVFARENRAALRTKHAGAPAALVAQIEPFLARLGPLEGALVPVHTELLDSHLYVEERGGHIELSGLIDFADARLAPAPYEFSGPIEFVFKGEPGLLRAFLLAYGVDGQTLTSRHAELHLAWLLTMRFSTLERLLRVVAPRVPASLEELATLLCSVAPG